MCTIIWVLFIRGAIILNVEQRVTLGDSKGTRQDSRDDRMMDNQTN